jgi:hypothetical protein
MRELWSELRRRKVVRVAIVYMIGAWVLLQVGDIILGLGDFPAWTGKVLLAAVALGFPLAFILSWIFDITPEGVVATGPAAAAIDLKIAEAIQTSYRKNTERRDDDLAYHLVDAGNLADPDQVIHWSAVAGNNAMKTAAFEQAAHYFSTAITELGDQRVSQRVKVLAGRTQESNHGELQRPKH